MRDFFVEVSMIGEFMKRSDIPTTAVVFKLHNGSEPLFLVDTIYNVTIRTMLGEDVAVSQLPLNANGDVKSILSNFGLFNLNDDLERIVNNRLCNSSSKCDLTGYIKAFSNKFFRFRREQKDACFVLSIVQSELRLFAEMNDIEGLRSVYYPEANFRTTQRKTEPLIVNEVAMLKNIKFMFNNVYDDIYLLLHTLRNKAIADLDPNDKRITELDL